MSEGYGMSILIKREMPKGCWACPFAVGKHYECLFTKKSYNWGLTTRPSDCPLIEVQPHGRLIDADFEEQHYTSMTVNPTSDVTKQDKRNSLIIIEALQKAKTIIEAEGSNE